MFFGQFVRLSFSVAELPHLDPKHLALIRCNKLQPISPNREGCHRDFPIEFKIGQLPQIETPQLRPDFVRG
jgi:hypothetical protein